MEFVVEIAGEFLEFIIGLFIKNRRKKSKSDKVTFTSEIFWSFKTFLVTVSIIVIIAVIAAFIF